jgi:hypothetical protein
MDLSDYEKRSILAIAGADRESEIMLAQFAAASVTLRDYTGVGLYTHLSIPQTCPSLDVTRWKIEDMPKGHAFHPDLEAGAGLILWLKDGYITCLESYAFGGDWPSYECLFKLAV